jgi:transcriptional regulator CtsR
VGGVSLATLADEIERYLRERLAQSASLAVQRGDLAQRFRCAPSQVTYVLVTRFTPERGYLVESRRGGGGFIRLHRLPVDRLRSLAALSESMDQQQAEDLIDRLLQAGELSAREAMMLRAVADRRTLGVGLPLRDELRARVVRAALAALTGREGQVV